jgi:molecular chaperone Hsp33
MPDRIVTATTADGSISIVAGITTELVRETQRRHELAPTASAALGRLVTAGALLGATLKGSERLSLQIVGDGPLRSLVAEVFIPSPQHIGARGYTQVPDVDLPLNTQGKFDVGGAVGRGRLQVTRSYEVGQPYMGVVALASGEIGDDIAAYLADSEQIPSVVAVGVLANPAGIKAAGGAIAQVMPGADESTIAVLEAHARQLPPVTTQIDGGASAEDLARNLAGALDLRIHGAFEVSFTCRCTREKVEVALLGLGRDELAKIRNEQEQTEATCEFCRQRYVLTRDEVGSLIGRLEQRGT